jgi:uncharacterized protein (DUF1697 family)
MALVVFLRGVNVGGHRAFRPSVLAADLKKYEVVNIGAAGTFVVRRPGSRAKFRAELQRRLPFVAEIMICDAEDVLRLETEHPFEAPSPGSNTVHFVSVLSKAGSLRATLPIALPPGGEWLVQVISQTNQFIFGMYRRHMKTIGHLGRLDKIFGAPVTTRNWNTILAITRILKKPNEVKQKRKR